MSLAMLETGSLKNPKLVNEVITQNVGYEVDQLIKGDVKLDVAVGKQCLVLQNEVFIQRNSYTLYGFLGDRGNGRWEFVGEGRIEFSNGQKQYGTWGDIENGQREFVGKGRIEHSNGRKDYGTWGDKGNGRWGFVGEGRLECPDGSNVYGTFEKKANGQWEFNKTKSSSS